MACSCCANRCCGCTKQFHERLFAAGSLMLFVCMVLYYADSGEEYGQNAVIVYILLTISGLCILTAAVGLRCTSYSDTILRDAAQKKRAERIYRKFRTLSLITAAVQFAATSSHYYVFTSNNAWYRFKDGVLIELLHPTPTVQQQLRNIYGFSFASILFEVLLYLSEECRLYAELAMVSLYGAIMLGSAFLVEAILLPGYCLKHHEEQYSSRVVLFVMNAASLAIITAFQVSMLISILVLRKRWSKAPFFPNLKQDFTSAIAHMQTILGYMHGDQRGRRDASSVTQIEMPVRNPLPRTSTESDNDGGDEEEMRAEGASRSSSSSEENDEEDEPQGGRLRGEKRRLIRLQHRINSHKKALRMRVASLQAEQHSNPATTTTTTTTAAMQRQVDALAAKVEQDAEYLRKQTLLKRVHRSIDWRYLPFDVTYLRVHSSLCNILILSGGYLWVQLLYDWANIFYVDNDLITLHDVNSKVSALGGDLKRGALVVVLSALSSLLALLLQMMYITVVTLGILVFMTAGNNEASPSVLMLSSVTFLAVATYVAYGFTAFAATSTKGSENQHSIYTTALWFAVTICLVWALLRITLAMIGKQSGRESSFDRHCDANEDSVRQKLRPPQQQRGIPSASLAYRQELHDRMSLPEDAPERNRGQIFPVLEGKELSPAAATPDESSASFMVHPSFKLEVVEDEEKTVLRIHAKSTRPLVFTMDAQDVMQYFIPIPSEPNAAGILEPNAIGGDFRKRESDAESPGKTTTSGIQQAAPGTRGWKLKAGDLLSLLKRAGQPIYRGIYLFKHLPPLMAIGMLLSAIAVMTITCSNFESPLFLSSLKEIDSGLITFGTNIDYVVDQAQLASAELNRTASEVYVATSKVDSLSSEERSALDAVLESTLSISVDSLFSSLELVSNATRVAQTYSNEILKYATAAEDHYSESYPIYKQFVASWKSAYRAGCMLGAAVILLFTVIPMWSFHDDIRVLRKEKKPSPWRNISEFMKVRYVAKVIGVQYSIAYCGVYFYALTLSAILVFFVDPTLRGLLGDLLSKYSGLILGFALVIIFQMYFLDGYIFENKFSKGQFIKEPRYFGVMMLLMAFYGIFTGLFTVLVRFIIGLAYTGMALCRLDISVLPPNLAKQDQAFRTYVSTVNFFQQYTAPIFLTSVASLRDITPSGTSTDAEERKRTQQARSRWHLAYTLIRNPALTRCRSQNSAAVPIIPRGGDAETETAAGD